VITSLGVEMEQSAPRKPWPTTKKSPTSIQERRQVFDLDEATSTNGAPIARESAWKTTPKRPARGGTPQAGEGIQVS